MKRQLFSAFVLTAITATAFAPAASAVGFKFTTIQERQGEVIQDGEIENFRSLQRAR